MQCRTFIPFKEHQFNHSTFRYEKIQPFEGHYHNASVNSFDCNVITTNPNI